MTHSPPEYFQCDHGYEQCAQYQTEIAALKAALQAMADALQWMVDNASSVPFGMDAREWMAGKEKARAALALSHKGE